jgi:5-methylcytosine-specific restriction endonuclease McrA
MSAVLERPTLVLNRNWQPVGVATVAKSLVKVWNETARIVDPDDYCHYSWSDWAQLIPTDDELVIRTRTNRLRVPEVVVLTSYDRLPSNAVTFSRRNIFKRDRFTCQYCGRRQGRSVQNALTAGGNRSIRRTPLGEQTGHAGPGSEELTIDHVLPRAQGGNLHLGELRPGVHRLQRDEGGPDAGAGADATAPAAGATCLEAAVCLARTADQ